MACSCPQVFLDGQLSGYFDRNEGPETLQLTAPLNPSAAESGVNGTVLDILVSAMGRLNFGCGWDEKGLTGGNVTLDGAMLHCVAELCLYPHWSRYTWADMSFNTTKHDQTVSCRRMCCSLREG